MSLNSSQVLDFSQKLIEWFWKFGITRKGAYKLSTSDWLRGVYDANRRAFQAEDSGKNLRPAFALWGPSQAGKSTLLSNFLDEKVWSNLQPEDKVDGTRSGLHWPGSAPCVFFVDLPKNQMERAEGLLSMNPYTGGRDASAVLTRFVRGSLDGEAGAYHVRFPKYPVQLRFLGEKQVLHGLAMGYDSECLGSPQEAWQQREWSQIEFVNGLDKFNMAHPVPENAPVNREAFEIIYSLCEVLEDLVSGKVRRFQKLALSARAEDWQSMVYSLLEQRSLLASPENARLFAAQLLWDGSPTISEYYGKLLKMLASIQVWQADRTVYTSLEVATRLLDMDTYDLVERGQQPLPRICYRSEGDAVFIDLNEGKAVIENVEEFGSLQGLVWEIVVPVNFDNLSPSPFTEFLGRGDLLDFPGVANELANDVKRIAAWPDIPEEERARLDKGQFFSPYLFFSKILKRGKTASIVSTYAKRLTIDGFTIFLYLDKHPPVNADQIQSGINTWWSCMAQDYDEKLGGRSPLPLNLALTWWKGLFDDYKSLERQGQEYFVSKLGILRAMGRVSNPGVLWSSCALNYYKYDRGKPADDLIPSQELFGALLKEKDVLLQFASPQIREQLEANLAQWEGKSEKNLKQKFETWAEQQREKVFSDPGLQTLKIMLEDRDKGGAADLLKLLCAQLDELAGGAQLNRAKILEESKEREAASVERLLQGEFIFPPPEPRDIRRENLLRFRDNLEQAVTRKKGRAVELLTEEEMRPVNLALRELLNVDYAVLELLPTFNHSLNEAFILRQYQAWIRKQAARWRGLDITEPSQPSSWNLLGLTSPVLVEVCLNSLVESVTVQQREEAARWLREDVRAGHEGAVGQMRRNDHRPFLAVRMSNLLVGDHVVDYDGESKPASYAAVIEPFLRHQLPALINSPVQALVQVNVPGTKELEELCDEYQIERAAPATH
ncbi:MAG: hypothetical protein ABSF38_11860 [Verrucomicrobiota bacterium]|jgi:hypothetical protein